MWAIIKKEIKGYFLSPIGYVFIGLFLAMCSIFFYLDVFFYSSIKFEYMFYSAAIVLTFIVPILTMRMFSEERKSGTEQILYTSPRSIFSIVMGKFLGAAFVIFIAEILTLIYFVILLFFGIPNILTALICLVGFFLLSLSYIAFGMFASSLTENQIISGVITMAGLIGIWLIPNIVKEFTSFSLMSAFLSSFPEGFMTYKGLILFISYILLFVFLTIVIISRRKSIK